MNDARRAEARRLRQETRMSLAELRHHFGVSRDTMADWLWGLSTPEWTQRPRGAKAKPWEPNRCRLQFINSDPALILLFLRFADLLGVDRSTCSSG